MARMALAVLVVLLVSAAAEAGSNYRRYNDPTWGNRWKQSLKIRVVNFQPYIAR